MRTINILYSHGQDLENLRKTILTYPPDRVLIQVYTGFRDRAAAEKLHKNLASFFTGYPLIGISSTGEILDTRTHHDTILISVSLFQSTKVKTVLIDQNDDMRKAGKDAGEAVANEQLKAVIAFGCGMYQDSYLDSTEFLDALSLKAGGVPITGGLSGGRIGNPSSFYVFTDTGFSSAGFALASLSGSRLRTLLELNIDWIPIGKKMTVTKLIGKRLYEIEGITFMDLYGKYLGIGKNHISSFSLVNQFPLMIERKGLSYTCPVSKIYDDGSVELIQKMHAGEQVRFSMCDARLHEESALSLNQRLKTFSPESVFSFSCDSRRVLLGEDIYVDMLSFEGLRASCGFYTFGEFYSPPGKDPRCLQQAMTVLALSEESEPVSEIYRKPPMPKHSEDPHINRFQIQKRLTHLIMTITEELEQKNCELATLAHSDGLTGLGNRRSFDSSLADSIKTHSRSQTPFTIILLDVDHFKLFNDLYGHVDGDDCLRNLGLTLKNALQRTEDKAFRYGGEEFACLLPSTDRKGASVVAENIRSKIEALKIPHEQSSTHQFVTVSLGVYTAIPDKNSTPDEMIEKCDALLYKAKKEGRNRFIPGGMSGPETL